MNVAVLGASGSVGGLVVDKLLADGHEVVAVARSPIMRKAGSSLVQANGDLTDPAFIRGSIGGCDAVVSCLGQSRASKSLFARRTSPPDILRRVAAATIEAIDGGGQHLVYLSAFGVGADRKRHALLFRLVLRLSSIGDAYVDHDAAETAIRASGLRWTIVRPVGLTEKDEEVPMVDKGSDWSSFENASRRSVAAFLVQCVEERGPAGRTITLGEASADRRSH